MGIERGAEAAEVSSERKEPDVLLGQSVLVVDVEFAAALGLPDVDPIGGPVGADEPITLDEGLQQHGAVAVARLPAGNRRQVRASTEEASFLTCTHGRIRKRALLTTRCKRASRWAALQPMNRSHGTTFQAPGGKPQHGEHLRPAEHQIAQLCSRQRGIAEVMVAVHVLPPERRFRSRGDRAYLQFSRQAPEETATAMLSSSWGGNR